MKHDYGNKVYGVPGKNVTIDFDLRIVGGTLQSIKFKVIKDSSVLTLGEITLSDGKHSWNIGSGADTFSIRNRISKIINRQEFPCLYLIYMNRTLT